MPIPETEAKVEQQAGGNGATEPTSSLWVSETERKTIAQFYQQLESGKAQLQTLQSCLNALVNNALAARGLTPDGWQVSLDTGQIAPKEKK